MVCGAVAIWLDRVVLLALQTDGVDELGASPICFIVDVLDFGCVEFVANGVREHRDLIEPRSSAPPIELACVMPAGRQVLGSLCCTKGVDRRDSLLGVHVKCSLDWMLKTHQCCGEVSVGLLEEIPRVSKIAFADEN